MVEYPHFFSRPPSLYSRSLLYSPSHFPTNSTTYLEQKWHSISDYRGSICGQCPAGGRPLWEGGWEGAGGHQVAFQATSAALLPCSLGTTLNPPCLRHPTVLPPRKMSQHTLLISSPCSALFVFKRTVYLFAFNFISLQ